MLLLKICAGNTREKLTAKEASPYAQVMLRIDQTNITSQDLETLITFFDNNCYEYKPRLNENKYWVFDIPAVFLYCYFLIKLERLVEVQKIAEIIGLKNIEYNSVELDFLVEILNQLGIPSYGEFVAEYPLKIVAWYFAPHDTALAPNDAELHLASLLDIELQAKINYKAFPAPHDEIALSLYKINYVLKLGQCREQGYSILEKYLYACYEQLNLYQGKK